MIKVYSSYLIYVLFILFTYLFALCYLYFCLFMLSILLFVVVDVVVTNSFFNSFHCSCSGSSVYFTFFCRLSVLCCLCCHCLLELYFSFSIITLYLFLFLFTLLTHCVSDSNYFHRYLYDLGLVLFVWLLTLLVQPHLSLLPYLSSRKAAVVHVYMDVMVLVDVWIPCVYICNGTSVPAPAVNFSRHSVVKVFHLFSLEAINSP